jgi:TRAP transporter TAXI family solute receptor
LRNLITLEETMRAAFFAISAGLLALAQSAAAQPYNLTVAGYSPGGLVSTIGTGLDAALNAAYPGSAVTYQTSSGGLANAMLLERKSVPLAFISDTELNVVVHGKPPFKQPLTNLRMLFSPYSSDSRFQATHFLTTKAWAEKYGIHSIADIAKKKPPMRIGINRPGNLDGDVSIAVLTANGISLDDIKKWGGQVVRAASREMTSLMLDRRLDVATFGISINHARIQEMEHGLDLAMITYDEATAKKVNEAIGAKPCQIKAGEYKFLPKDTYSNCVGLSVVVRADMDEKLAYNVTKGIFEHIDKYKAAHRLLQKAVTLQSMSAPGQVPFHPGAAKYLREKGLLK